MPENQKPDAISATPEHAKLEKVQELSQLLGEFLDWAHTENMRLCYFDDGEDTDGEHYDRDAFRRWRPCYDSINQLLARFFDIDLQKLEAEKRAMIALVRELRGE